MHQQAMQQQVVNARIYPKIYAIVDLKALRCHEINFLATNMFVVQSVKLMLTAQKDKCATQMEGA